jgi:hypothetical protein
MTLLAPLERFPISAAKIPGRNDFRATRDSQDENEAHRPLQHVAPAAVGRGSRRPDALVRAGPAGYASQNIAPVHFGLGEYEGRIDVEVTFLTRAGRRATRVRNVEPRGLAGKRLTVRQREGARRP